MNVRSCDIVLDRVRFVFDSCDIVSEGRGPDDLAAYVTRATTCRVSRHTPMCHTAVGCCLVERTTARDARSLARQRYANLDSVEYSNLAELDADYCDRELAPSHRRLHKV